MILYLGLLMSELKHIPPNTVERLILYRWTLKKYRSPENTHIVSRKLSELTGFSSAQIRRDFMSIGYAGSPGNGYRIDNLVSAIDSALLPDTPQNIAVIGIGQLGKAFINYISGRSSRLKIKAAFDIDTKKTGRVIHGCRTFHVDRIEEIIAEENITLAILAIPADHVQSIADRLYHAGVKAFLNYSSVKLTLPEHIYIENRDMLSAVEKIAYFARTSTERTKHNEGIG